MSNEGKVESKPDIAALMADIRSRVKADVAGHRDAKRPFKPMPADDRDTTRMAGELVHAEELYFLNTHYTYGRLNLEGIKTHRGGVIGKFIVKAKRKLLSIVWDNLLRDYFESEREFQANLVRFLNNVSKYVDARDASNFWDLIRKIDYDITKALERIERINDEQMASLRSSERRLQEDVGQALKGIALKLERLTTSSEQHQDKLAALDSVARGLEGLVARLTKPAAEVSAAVPAAMPLRAPDLSYVLLENRYRGSESEISSRVSIYPPMFAETDPVKRGAPVMEIGPGRGELLLLFKGNHIAAFGVDSDRAMVELARKRGVDARPGEGLDHLRSLPDHSLGGLIAVQVIEHLTSKELQELFDLCNSKVKTGGRVIFETINPQSLLALSSNYFRDPSHQSPLHPDTVSYGLTLAGMNVLEVKYLSPVAEEAQLKMLQVEEYMTPRWAFLVEQINHNFKQLNQLLYGYQDYCVVAEVR